MSTAVPLADRSKKDLADLARRQGVRGWETMSKEQLVKTLARAKRAKAASPAAKPTVRKSAAPSATRPVKPVAKPAAKSAAKVTKPAKPASKPAARTPAVPAGASAPRPTPRPASPSARPAQNPAANGSHSGNGSAKSAPRPATATKPAPPRVPVAPPIAKPVARVPVPLTPPPPGKDLAGGKTTPGGFTKDRILLMVPDPYWLHAYWELTTQSVQRAEAALRQDWHGAKPIIRLFDVTSQDTTCTSETPVRDINIHGYCNNWYIDVPQPPRQYRADIGYVSKRGDFYVLARSNPVTPPKAGATEAIDVGWADLDNKKAERVLAMSTGFEQPDGDTELRKYLEEKLRRPMGGPRDTGFGSGAVPPGSIKKFFFELDAKLVVFGRTEPTAHVTLGNEPIQLGGDGSFSMILSLPDSRQIIPAVATSIDGVEERTIVLAVERNTKHLDPMVHDQMNET